MLPSRSKILAKEISRNFQQMLSLVYTHTTFAPVDITIVTRNGKIVWKHGTNGPFYTLMLRTKLYQNLFFSTVHGNINKRNSCAIKTVCELPSYLPMWLISWFFLSSVEIQTCQDQTLSEKCCKSSKKQISTIPNTEWRAKLVDQNTELPIK